MSNKTHGGEVFNTYDSASSIPLKPSTRTSYAWALPLSAGLHFLLIWLVTQLLFETHPPSSATRNQTIHLSFATINAQQPKTDNRAIAQPPSPPVKAGDTISPHAQSSQRTKDRQADRTISDDQLNDLNIATKPSAAQIKATAESIAKAIAAEDVSTLEQKRSIIAKRLEKVFSQSEVPGVSELADGTIRVVTEFGIVYCIKPQDDSRILGPEDNMPVSVTCH
ncbi:MAG: hypothetical protein P8Z77_09280 [Candidatus Thiodiazotropha sp.]